MDKEEKYYCWGPECKKEISEPIGCCSGHDCGCMGLPIDPPFCSDKCMENYQVEEANKSNFTEGLQTPKNTT